MNAAFSYAGTEVIALVAAEAKNPGVTIPRATRTVFVRERKTDKVETPLSFAYTAVEDLLLLCRRSLYYRSDCPVSNMRAIPARKLIFVRSFTDPRLLDGSGTASASPFVIAIEVGFLA